MKYIIAVIQPHRLEKVQEELAGAGIPLMTVSTVMGCGRQKGHTRIYRGVKEMGNLLKKMKLEIAVNEDFVRPAVEAIIRGARTGEIGDGKIFVFDLPECIRIRTDERGVQAIG